MSVQSADSHDVAVAALVRQNAGSAGFAAASLLLFGFGMFAPPTVTDLFSAGDAVFTYTLRLGGIAMAVTALGSLLGLRVFLIVDAIVSVAIGALLATSALMMIFAGGFGFNQIVSLVIGWMFVSAGIRNGRNHAAIIRATHEGPARQPFTSSRDLFPRERHESKETVQEAIPLAPAYPSEDEHAEDRTAGDPIREAVPLEEVDWDSEVDPILPAPTQPESPFDLQPDTPPTSDATRLDTSTIDSLDEPASETPAPETPSSDQPSRAEPASDDVSGDDDVSSGGYLASLGKKPPPRSI